MNVLNKLSGLTMLIRLFTMLAVLAVASSLPVHDATYAKAITDAIRLGQVDTLQTLLEQADDIEELLTAEKFVNLSPLLVSRVCGEEPPARSYRQGATGEERPDLRDRLTTARHCLPSSLFTNALGRIIHASSSHVFTSVRTC